MAKRKIASDLSRKALSDNAKYDVREAAYAWTEDIYAQLMESVKLYHDKIDQDEFCVVMVIAGDPLLVNLRRRKFYCWPYLPSPRPNQAVFLYNKPLGRITKRLWVLPNERAMAIFATENLVVKKEHVTMKKWSISFFRGTFWRDIRKQHDIKMLSQEEFDFLNREELIKRGLEDGQPRSPEPFDFSKINPLDVGDPDKPVPLQNP